MTEHICVVWIRPTGGTTSEEFFSRPEAIAWRNRLQQAGYDAALVTLHSPPPRRTGRQTKRLAVAAMLAGILLLPDPMIARAADFNFEQWETNQHLNNIERSLRNLESPRPLPLWVPDRKGEAQAEADRARARYYDALTRELESTHQVSPKRGGLAAALFGTGVLNPPAATPPPCRTETRTTDGTSVLCTTCCDAFRCATQCDPQ